jgi:hypothetical protein
VVDYRRRLGASGLGAPRHGEPGLPTAGMGYIPDSTTSARTTRMSAPSKFGD